MTLNLSDLEQLALAATPGPWKIVDAATKDPANYIFGISRVLEGWDREPTVAFPATDCQHMHSTCIGIDRRDAAFIAAANPTTVLALIKRVRELEAGLDEACDWSTRMDGRYMDRAHASELLPMYTRVGERHREPRIAELRALSKGER